MSILQACLSLRFRAASFRKRTTVVDGIGRVARPKARLPSPAGKSPSKTGVNALMARVSILLAKAMDCRVKPGNDEDVPSFYRNAAFSRLHTDVARRVPGRAAPARRVPAPIRLVARRHENTAGARPRRLLAYLMLVRWHSSRAPQAFGDRARPGFLARRIISSREIGNDQV
jgi:hypothetical protein